MKAETSSNKRLPWPLPFFGKRAERLPEADRRGVYGRVTAVTGLMLNLLLALMKFLIGSLSGSVSITADAANNLSDASSSLISLLGFKLAARPADPEHPYGHGRYEYLAGLSMAVLVVIIGVELLKIGVERIISPSPVRFQWLSGAVLAGAILLKMWMMFFYQRTGDAIRSKTLQAAATDSRNDVLTSLAVLLSALCARFFGWRLDGPIAALVSLFIIYSGFSLIKDTLDPLLGSAPDRELVQEIRQHVMAYPGVLGTHDLLLHDYGPGRRFGSVHVEMDAQEDPLISHEIIDQMERDFMANHHLHMVVHLDPVDRRDSAVGEMHQWLAEAVKGIHPDLSIHDLRLVRGHTMSRVIFDCVRPDGLKMTDSQLKAALSRLVSEKYPGFYAVITIDDSFVPVH